MDASSSFDFAETMEGHEVEAALLSASITDEQLQSLAGTRELESVTFLQMAVDSEFVPLSCLGERLPALEQLKLNGSSLPSLRYLGTTMTRLRVLWLCRCGLKELDNLGALPELQVSARGWSRRAWLGSCSMTFCNFLAAQVGLARTGAACSA